MKPEKTGAIYNENIVNVKGKKFSNISTRINIMK